MIAVHGGIAAPRDKVSVEIEAEVRAGLRSALDAGFNVLQSKSGDATEAVIAAVVALEDSHRFNAGKGAVFNAKGTIELDAAIMEGKCRRAGAIAAAQRVRNPIKAAHAIMTQSPAVFLVGSAADDFAEAIGLATVDPSYFAIESRRSEYLAWKEQDDRRTTARPSATDIPISRGTVGAVALDARGNLAAGTSTGGVSFKPAGRVGDCGVLGAGTMADNRTCAVSATGDGEIFIRATAAHSVSARMLYARQSVSDAAQDVIDEIHEMGGMGGLIALDRAGKLAMPFHATGMYRGFADVHGNIQVALYDD